MNIVYEEIADFLQMGQIRSKFHGILRFRIAHRLIVLVYFDCILYEFYTNTSFSFVQCNEVVYTECIVFFLLLLLSYIFFFLFFFSLSPILCQITFKSELSFLRVVL